jgi:hypothetical protein
MREFLFKINKKDAAALGAVRCLDGLTAAEDGDMIWLRAADAGIAIRQLPVVSTYTIDNNNYLFLPGGLTPVDTLKQMQWQPLASFITVTLPPSALPGKINNSIPVRLIPSKAVQPGNALLTTLTAWKAYAETAPASRLHLLQFAVSEKMQVLITGNPLPPLPGTEYWAIGDILLPAGYCFELTIAATFIKEQINKEGDAFVVFDMDGHWQKISKTLFVPARRSAIRLTQVNNAVTGND